MATAKPSIMHQIKEKLFHGQKHVDADYEVAYGKFQHLSDSLHKLKASSHNYAASMYSIFLNSNNTAVEFGSLLEDSSVSNEYQQLTRELRTAHSQLNGDKQQLLTSKLQEQVLQPIDAQLNSFQAINGRIVKRNELHENLEYYLTKVAGLNTERDERASKGKVETSSQMEKHDRNQHKLDAARNEYTQFTASLMADLHNTWSQRVAVLGPALAGFIEVEKQFVELYRNELLSVHKSGELQQAPAGSVPASLNAGDFGSAVPGQALGPGDLTTVNSTPRRNSASANANANNTSTVYPPLSQQQQLQIQQQQQVAAAALPATAPVGGVAVVDNNSLSTGLQQSHAMAATQQPMPTVAATPVSTSSADQFGFESVNQAAQAQAQQQQQHQQQQQQAAIPSADPSAVQGPAPALYSSTQSLGQMSSAPAPAPASVDNGNNPFATPRSAVQAPAAAAAPVASEQNPFEKGQANEGAPIEGIQVKDEHEEESKRQRFEEEQKAKNVLA